MVIVLHIFVPVPTTVTLILLSVSSHVDMVPLQRSDVPLSRHLPTVGGRGTTLRRGGRPSASSWPPGTR